jgi:hypothetical protein
VAFTAETFAGVVWNVITVSLRQTIIPDRLLGRVNSVYRFFGWGMMPIGMAAGGLIVWFGEIFWGREFALRLPWLVAAGIYVAVLIYAVPRLTTEKVEAARAAGIAARATEGDTGEAGEPEADIAAAAISEAGIVTAPPPIDLDEGE